MARFLWTPPGGSTLELVLPHKMLFRQGGIARERSRFRSIGLDRRTVVTEVLGESGADIVTGRIRYIEEPDLLLSMLDDAANGALLTYEDDSGQQFPDLLLEASAVVEIHPDEHRFGYGEWERTLQLRATNDAALSQLFPNSVPTVLVLPSTSDNYVEIEDDPLVDISGDLGVRVAMALDDVSALSSVMAKFTGLSSLGDPSWLLEQRSSAPRFVYRDSTNSQFIAAATANLPVSDGEIVLLRVDLDVDNGTGGSDVSFYTKTGIAAADAYQELVSNSGWTQLGTTVTEATTNGDLMTNDLAMDVGQAQNGAAQQPNKFYAAVVYEGATRRLDLPFVHLAPGITSFKDRASGLDVELIQTGSPVVRLELDS